MAVTDTFSRQFTSSLDLAIHKNDGSLVFNADTFVEDWWYTNGTPLCFVFKKNVTCTNLQYAELLALLQIHVSHANGVPVALQFRRRKRFEDRVAEVVNAFATTARNKPSWIESVVSLYGPSLHPIVLMSPYRGSCIVHLPPHLRLSTESLYAMCAESGFIHSAGTSIYAAELVHASEQQLREKLHVHVTRHRVTDGKKLFFTPYAHEDFTKHDRADEATLRDGLDDLKIHVEKCYLGSERLVAVLHRLSREFSDTFLIPPPGDFRKVHEGLRTSKRSGVDTDHTIWLIADRRVAEGTDKHARAPVLICYDQIIVNKNPLHIMDEDKPAWIDHTTLPHTLAAAMLNIARPRCTASPMVVGDIFAGSGTVLLEAAKLNNVECVGSDAMPMCNILALDNATFFSWSSSEIRSLRNDLSKLLGTTVRAPGVYELSEDTHLRKDYEDARKWFERAAKGRNETIRVDAGLGGRLGQMNFRARMVVYLMARTHVRHLVAFARGSTEWANAFERETKSMIHLLDVFAEQRLKEEGEDVDSSANYVVFNARYSKGCATSADAFRAGIEKCGNVRVQDICKADAPVPKYDILITDPPYGFNTEEPRDILARTYGTAIRWMIASLRERGQLVLCLPAASYTGREIPAFCTAEWITQQVLAEAQTLGKVVMNPARIIPEPRELFSVPYYWEATRALRRTILHFQFENQP